jgi:flagellar basal-body rod protein FlgG
MYAALSGNLSAMRRMDIITNNLANVNTVGFKRDKASFESMLAGPVNPPAVPQSKTADPILVKENITIDFVDGLISRTGNALDLAIDGDGFFVVNRPEGPAYTRQGNFRMNGDGVLVTSDGFPVMGEGGEIRVRGSLVAIGEKGDVTVDGQAAGTLRVVDFPKPYNLTKVGSTMFTPVDPQQVPIPAQNMKIRQEHLESSNVEAVSEMVQLIDASRYFDTCQRVILGYDGMAAKAANDLGKL